MTERWEFRAPLKQVGDRQYLAANFRIGDQYFEDAMLATGFFGLVQVPEARFRRLVQAGYIGDVVPFETYARTLKPPEGGSEFVVTMGELDRGEFGFGLDLWKEPEGARANWGGGGVAYSRLMYPSTCVGFADVQIEGVHESAFFERAPIMCGRQTLIGSGLLSHLSRVSQSLTEIYGYLDVG